jgi:hypothetical protein
MGIGTVTHLDADLAAMSDPLGRLEGRALTAAAEEDLPDVPLPMGEVRGYVLLDPQTVLALVAALRAADTLASDIRQYEGHLPTLAAALHAYRQERHRAELLAAVKGES